MHSLADAPDSCGPDLAHAPLAEAGTGLRRLDTLALSGSPLWERNVRGAAPIPSFLFLGPKLDRAPRRLALITGPSNHDAEAVEGIADVMEDLAADPEPATGSTLYLYPSAIHGRLDPSEADALRHGRPHQTIPLLLAEEFRRLRFHAWLRILHGPHTRALEVRYGDVQAQPIAEDLIQHLQTQFRLHALLGHSNSAASFGSRRGQPSPLGIDLRFGNPTDPGLRTLVAAVVRRWISINRVLDTPWTNSTTHPSHDPFPIH